LAPLDEKSDPFLNSQTINGISFRHVEFSIPNGVYDDLLLMNAQEILDLNNKKPDPSSVKHMAENDKNNDNNNNNKIDDDEEKSPVRVKVSQQEFEDEIELYFKAANTQSYKLWVGNLQANSTIDSVRDLFSTFGKIQSIQVISKGKPFAFVRFYRAIDGAKAHSKMHRFVVEGIPLFVNVSENQ